MMRFGGFFFSLINLLFAVLFVVLGIFIFMVPRAPHFQQIAIDLLESHSPYLTFLGIGIGLVGILLLIAIFAMNRHHSYFFVMGGKSVTIDEAVIQKYLNVYWKNLFPGNEIHHDVVIKNGLIYLKVDLPHLPFPEQKQALERIDGDLKHLFAESFNYRKKFYVTASFQD